MRILVFASMALTALTTATSALEAAAGADSINASQIGITAKVDASNAILTIGFNALRDQLNDLTSKIGACGAVDAAYVPGSPSADADGCVKIVATPAGAVQSFNATSCPTGWSPLTAAAGRVIIGTGSMTSTGGTYSYARGDTGGEAKHALTIAEMPKHRFSFSYTRTDFKSNKEIEADDDDRKYLQQVTATGYTDYLGDDQPAENRMPYLALLYCIKN